MDSGYKQAWDEEVIKVADLGVCSVTGTAADGILRSLGDQCRLLGKPVTFVCYWTADGPRLILGAVSAAFSIGPSIRRPLGDGPLLDLRDRLQEALSEWWDTPEARAMVGENALKTQEVLECRRIVEAKLGPDLMQSLSTAIADKSRPPHEIQDAIRKLAALDGGGQVQVRAAEIHHPRRHPSRWLR